MKCSPEMIVHLARELWRVTLVGDPTPHIKALGERMAHPQPGDLVVSKTAFTTLAVQRVGVLEKTTSESGRACPTWYVRTDAGMTRWTNEEFFAVPPLDREEWSAKGWPESCPTSPSRTRMFWKGLVLLWHRWWQKR